MSLHTTKDYGRFSMRLELSKQVSCEIETSLFREAAANPPFGILEATFAWLFVRYDFQSYLPLILRSSHSNKNPMHYYNTKVHHLVAESMLRFRLIFLCCLLIGFYILYLYFYIYYFVGVRRRRIEYILSVFKFIFSKGSVASVQLPTANGIEVAPTLNCR